MAFDREIFFDDVRDSLFSGQLSQQQVDGMNFKLGQWEVHHAGKDLRWLAYPLATSMHETASTMWPIEEYGKGEGHDYGEKDPETGQTYYGRGDVQLTWRDNYRRATEKLGLSGKNDLEWHAEMALDPKISADVMYLGMQEGWFRSSGGTPNTLAKYFSNTKDDAFGARDIINGDKNVIPSWSHGAKIGTLIASYHDKFLTALEDAWVNEEIAPEPQPLPPEPEPAVVEMTLPPGIRLIVNGQEIELA